MDKHTQEGVRQRSLEIENDRLLAENAKLREALSYALRFGLTTDAVMSATNVAPDSAIANIRAALAP